MTQAISLPTLSAVGTIDAYIQAARRFPVLSEDEEFSLATRFREENDLDAARQLVLSHLRLVIAISRGYLGYGLPHADLIQEGNIGLMKAVKRFDPRRGVRLVSFAIHWIKAEIHEYVLKNWRMVKLATTKAQRKLFFNLRSMREGSEALNPHQVADIAQRLNVKADDVLEMDTRLAGHDLALDGDSDDAGWRQRRRRCLCPDCLSGGSLERANTGARSACARLAARRGAAERPGQPGRTQPANRRSSLAER